MKKNNIKRCCDECKYLKYKLEKWNSASGEGGFRRIYICKLDLPYGIYETSEGKHEPHNAFGSCEYFERRM